MKQLRSILAYDAEWCSSELTEQHAFLQAAKLLPEVPGVLYFGFPWATLIERLHSRHSSAESLKEVLDSARLLLHKQKSVVTVCQHVDMLNYGELFQESCITKVFWPYAAKEQDCFPDNGKIKILPFPLFPEEARACAQPPDTAKKHLYSFVGPDTKGCTSDKGRILRESIFSLCPLGPGSNATLLWESISCGSIPVVLSDNYLLPGSKALWELATVFCPEKEEDIEALPERLAAMARDQELLDRKRHAMRQLRMIYGPECFVYDIQKLFLSLAGETADIAPAQPGFSYGKLYSMAAEITGAEDLERSVADIFILGCSSRVLVDSSGFLHRFTENEQFRTAYRQALLVCGREHADAMVRALEFRGIDLERMPYI